MVSQAEILERLGERFTPHPGRGAGQRPGRAVPRRRRPADGGRHRQRLRAVLRQLRPGAAHRRRPAAQLPVRPPRGRPAGADARRRQRRRARRPRHRRDVGQEVRATASTGPTSSSRSARCQRSAAEPVASRASVGAPGDLAGSRRPPAAPGAPDPRPAASRHSPRRRRRTAGRPHRRRRSSGTGWSMTTRSTKHAVRIAIVTRYCLSRRAWSSVRASGALVTDCGDAVLGRVVGTCPLYVARLRLPSGSPLGSTA